jgi:hypothetical protein
VGVFRAAGEAKKWSRWAMLAAIAPGLVAGEQVRRGAASRLVLEIDVGGGR